MLSKGWYGCTLRCDVGTLIERCEELPEDATLITPLASRRFRIDEIVLEAFEGTGIDREQLVGVDRGKVDEALDVVSVPESAVYDVSESEYVRKADVDEERKETRLQGLKDRLAVSDDSEAEVLHQEVDRLEQEIEELTEFSPGSSFGDRAEEIDSMATTMR